MLIPCSRTQAIFAVQGVRLDQRTPAFMVWDEHGGTFVLRVDELAATEVAADEPETGIILEIPLSSGEELIRALEARLDHARRHPFLQSPRRMHEERSKRVDELFGRLPEAMRRLLSHTEGDLRLRLEKLDAFSPLKVLGRGYAIAEKLPERAILRRATQVQPGDQVRVRLHEGALLCEVRNAEDRQEGR